MLSTRSATIGTLVLSRKSFFDTEAAEQVLAGREHGLEWNIKANGAFKLLWYLIHSKRR